MRATRATTPTPTSASPARVDARWASRRASSVRASSSAVRRRSSANVFSVAAMAGTGDDYEDARRATLLEALPRELSFAGFVDHAMRLGEEDVVMLVEAFCLDERLTSEFCEEAFNAVYAAVERRAPEEEVMGLLELAKTFTTSYRTRMMPPEAQLLDSTLAAARRALVAEDESARSDILRIIAEEIDHAIECELVSETEFFSAFRSFRVGLERDERAESSIASELFDADETDIAQLMDPMEELNASAETRKEMLRACELVVVAVERFSARRRGGGAR
jgi:hypothetical protein